MRAAQASHFRTSHGTVTRGCCSTPHVSVANASPYTPQIAPDAPALADIGYADTVIRPANTPDVTYTAASATDPIRRSRMRPSGTNPTRDASRCSTPACTASDVVSRHHSPFVV